MVLEAIEWLDLEGDVVETLDVVGSQHGGTRVTREGLSDIGSLILQVRNLQSRQNLEEAVRAYYGGAYRAAIMSTWVATAFDIIAKLRELAAYGDKQAIQCMSELDEKVSRKDIRGLAAFEDSLLDRAERDFQLISLEQRVQLQRLKDDRNLCAHPAFTSDGALFDPLPELVRAHIAHAVSGLLRHGPVRGSSSLQAIAEDIRSETFPVTPDAAGRFLLEKYLRYARPALIDNLFKLLVKAALRDIDEWRDHRTRALVALRGLSLIMARDFDEWMVTNLASQADGLAGSQVLRLFGLIVRDRRYWNWIGEQHRIQLADFLRQAGLRPLPELEPQASGWGVFLGLLAGVVGASERGRLAAATGLDSVDQLFNLLEIPELREPLLALFNKLGEAERIDLIAKNPRPEFASAAIAIYAAAGGFRHAERLGRNVILPMAPHFASAEVVQVFDAVLHNGEIYAASGTEEILIQFVEKLSSRRDLDLRRLLNWQEFLEQLKDSYDHYDDFEKMLQEKKLLMS